MEHRGERRTAHRVPGAKGWLFLLNAHAHLMATFWLWQATWQGGSHAGQAAGSSSDIHRRGERTRQAGRPDSGSTARAEASSVVCSMTGELPALGLARVYWQGSHRTQQVAGKPFSAPLGKLHAEGLALLKGLAWEKVGNDEDRSPGWAFTTRRGADFPAFAATPGLPAVRQLPLAASAVLDDKLLMAEALGAEGCGWVAPKTWTDLDAFLREKHASAPLSSSSKIVDAGAAAPAAAEQARVGGEQLWFLKHRRGVKGQAVYPYASLPALLDRLTGMSSHSRQQFVVQAGVSPPLLLPVGRKATLRAHVLLVLSSGGQQEGQREGQQGRLERQQGRQGERQQGRPAGQQAEQQAERRAQQQGPTLRAYVHEDVIVQEHAQPLQPEQQPEAGQPSAAAAGAGKDNAGSPAAGASSSGRPAASSRGPPGLASVAVHVSSRGRGHPRPYLLSQLAGHPGLQGQIWEQVCDISAAAVAAAARRGLVPADADPRATLCQLFAFDFQAAAGDASEAGAALSEQRQASQQEEQQAARDQQAARAQQAASGEQAQAAAALRPRLFLLEANSYPAIASGTMKDVPRSVYTRLIGDMLSLAVLPALAAAERACGGEAAVPEPVLGGFVRVL